MKYQEALDYIESLQSYGIVPGLDTVRELCRLLGDPQHRLKFVHIAGTNGKGSVLAYVSTILKHAGYRVGRYSSPTIFEYRERIQVNGRNITKAALCEGLEIIKNACYEIERQGMHHPTPFEVETALGFWYFEKMGCDIVVLETGMGGLLDATNVVRSTLVAVLTPISMDHMNFLGRTLAEIAGQKAGILKEGCTAVSAVQEAEAMAAVEQAAEELRCELQVVSAEYLKRVRYGTCGKKGIAPTKFDYDGGDGTRFRGLEIALAGKVQPENAALAVTAVLALGKKGFPVSEAALRGGLRETVWPGRFSVVSAKPLFVVDGAHNEDAARKLSQSIEFYFTNRRITYIMGMLRDKECEKVIGLTHRYADQIITVTPPDNPRALHAYELAQRIAAVHPQVTAVDSLEEAVELARLFSGPEDVILAFGSLSYLGRLIRIAER